MKKILLKVGDIQIPAILNNTKTALDFERKLPFKVTCHDSGNDYCGKVARGRFDPGEYSLGWKNGDIMLYNGWFALLYDGEEKSKEYGHTIIIGHFDDIDAVRNLPKTIRLTVSKA